MPPQDANPTPSFGGFGFTEGRNGIDVACLPPKQPEWAVTKMRDAAGPRDRAMEEPGRSGRGAREAEASLRSTRDGAVLADIACAFASALDIGQAYGHFVEQVRRIVPLDGMVISVLEHDAGSVTTGYALVPGLDPHRDTGDSYPLDEIMTKRVVREGRTALTVIDTESDVRERYPGSPPAFEAGMRSCLSVPLV